MRTNRSSFTSTPAGSAKALDQKPKPKRSKREINQLMLMLFFILLPVLGLLAIFFQPMRWLFMAVVVAAVAAMWLVHAFLFPGRMILTAVYGLLAVFTLVTALNAGHSSTIRSAQTTLLPTIAPAALSLRSRIAVFGSSIRQTAIRMPEKSTRVVRLSMVSRNTGMCCSAYSIASSPLALRISVMESMLCVPSHRNSSLCPSVIVASSTVMPHCWA